MSDPNVPPADDTLFDPADYEIRLQNSDWREREAAAKELIDIGPAAAPLLPFLLYLSFADTDVDVRNAARAAAGQIDSAIGKRLSQFQENDNARLRGKVIQGWPDANLTGAMMSLFLLAQAGEDDEDAGKAMLTRLQTLADSYPVLYADTATALIDLVLNKVHSSYEDVDARLIAAAGLIKAPAAEFAGTLLELAQSADAALPSKLAAIQAFGRWGAKANLAPDQILQIAVVDDDEEVRAAAAAVAQTVLSSEKRRREAHFKLAETLLDADKTEDGDIRQRMAAALITQTGDEAPPENILKRLVAAVQDGDTDSETRQSIIAAFGRWRLRPGISLPELLQLSLSDDDETVRETALKVVKQLEPDAAALRTRYADLAAELLDVAKTDALNSRDGWRIRQDMVLALAAQFDAATLTEPLAQRLLATARNDGDEDVKTAVIKAFTGWQPLKKETMAEVITIAVSDSSIKADAREALFNNVDDELIVAVLLDLIDKPETDLAVLAGLIEQMSPAAREKVSQKTLDQLLKKASADDNPESVFVTALTLDAAVFLPKVLGQQLSKTAQATLGRILVDNHQQVMTTAWPKLNDAAKGALLANIKAVIAHDNWPTRRNAILWLGSNEAQIQRYSESEHELISHILKQRLDESDSNPETDPDVRMTIGMVLLLFERTLESNEQKHLQDQLRRRASTIDTAIKNIVAKEEWKALRSLISFWVEWIVLDDKYVGVALAEEEMRRSAMAVLPLVERLRHPLQLTDLHLPQTAEEGERRRRSLMDRFTGNRPAADENGANTPAEANGAAAAPDDNAADLGEPGRPDNLSALLNLFVPAELQGLAARLYFSEKLDNAERFRLQEWLAVHIGTAAALTNEERTQLRALPPTPDSRAVLNGRQLRHFLLVAITLTLEDRERELRRRITALLTTMSDPSYVQDNHASTPNAQEIARQRLLAMKVQLRRHAISYFAAQLRTETDIEIRENMARTLANLADPETGQSAIDALVFAVVGEERRQNRRQLLLSDYYLEPSKQRSEEAAQILHDAVAQAKSTLNSLRRLNQHLFYVGLAVFVFGFAVAIFSDGPTSQALGALTGIGGLAGVLRHMVKDPLDRIQNAMGNLVQMEAAFTSFMWELNLNQTFIQSRYVANGHLTQDEIQSTVDRVEAVMRNTMAVVETYTETTAQRIVTRIHKVAPVAVYVPDGGQTVTVMGQYLRGDDAGKKDSQGTIALNHVPVDAEIAKWDDNEVRFRLQNGDLLDINDGVLPPTIMVSLFIDGMETNALPLRLLKAAPAEKSAAAAVVSAANGLVQEEGQ